MRPFTSSPEKEIDAVRSLPDTERRIPRDAMPASTTNEAGNAVLRTTRLPRMKNWNSMAQGRGPRALPLLALLLLGVHPSGAADAVRPGSLRESVLRAGVDEIVFAVREVNASDGHWYANFGYYADDETKKAYRARGSLRRLDPRTGEVSILLDSPQGAIRDPQVHYDGRKIVFSFRKTAGGRQKVVHRVKHRIAGPLQRGATAAFEVVAEKAPAFDEYFYEVSYKPAAKK